MKFKLTFLFFWHTRL